MLLQLPDIFGRQYNCVGLSETLVFIETEIPAVCIVDKREPAVWSEPAYEFGLVFHYSPVPLLIPFQRFLCVPALGDVLSNGEQSFDAPLSTLERLIVPLN